MDEITEKLEAYVKIKDELDAVKSERDVLKTLNDELSTNLTTTNADVAKLQKIIANHVIASDKSDVVPDSPSLRDLFINEYRKNKKV